MHDVYGYCSHANIFGAASFSRTNDIPIISTDISLASIVLTQTISILEDAKDVVVMRFSFIRIKSRLITTEMSLSSRCLSSTCLSRGHRSARVSLSSPIRDDKTNDRSDEQRRLETIRMGVSRVEAPRWLPTSRCFPFAGKRKRCIPRHTPQRHC